MTSKALVNFVLKNTQSVPLLIEQLQKIEEKICANWSSGDTTSKPLSDFTVDDIDITKDCISPKLYLVGGSVRDWYRDSSELRFRDADFMIANESPLVIQELIKLGFSRIEATFPIWINPQDGSQYAIAMDENENPCSVEVDLGRRDFTMNAIAISLTDFSVIDPYHGIEDIQSRTIRMVHPKNLYKDPIRCLRALRFVARWKTDAFEINPSTSYIMNDIFKTGKLTSSELTRANVVLYDILMGLNSYDTIKLIHRIYPKMTTWCLGVRCDTKIMDFLSESIFNTLTPAGRFLALVGDVGAIDLIDESPAVRNAYKLACKHYCSMKYAYPSYGLLSPDERVDFLTKNSFLRPITDALLDVMTILDVKIGSRISKLITADVTKISNIDMSKFSNLDTNIVRQIRISALS